MSTKGTLTRRISTRRKLTNAESSSSKRLGRGVHSTNQLVYKVANVWVVQPGNSKKSYYFSIDKNNAINVAKEIAKKKKTGVEIYNTEGEVIKKISASQLAI
jgi:hypothetical protein